MSGEVVKAIKMVLITTESSNLHGKTIGLVGFGAILQRTLERLIEVSWSGSDSLSKIDRVLVYNPYGEKSNVIAHINRVVKQYRPNITVEAAPLQKVLRQSNLSVIGTSHTSHHLEELAGAKTQEERRRMIWDFDYDLLYQMAEAASHFDNANTVMAFLMNPTHYAAAYTKFFGGNVHPATIVGYSADDANLKLVIDEVLTDYSRVGEVAIRAPHIVGGHGASILGGNEENTEMAVSWSQIEVKSNIKGQERWHQFDDFIRGYCRANAGEIKNQVKNQWYKVADQLTFDAKASGTTMSTQTLNLFRLFFSDRATGHLFLPVNHPSGQIAPQTPVRTEDGNIIEADASIAPYLGLEPFKITPMGGVVPRGRSDSENHDIDVALKHMGEEARYLKGSLAQMLEERGMPSSLIPPRNTIFRRSQNLVHLPYLNQ